MIAGAVICAALVVAFLFLRPGPSLDGLQALLARGNFDQAQAILEEYVRANPGDQETRFLLARMAVERTDPKDPELALAQLKLMTPKNAQAEASMHVVQGKAYFLLSRFVDAEREWKEALRLDPLVAEASWGLLSLYSIQGRGDEMRKAALAFYAIEPSVHDQVQFLLQVIRYEAHAQSPNAVTEQLEKAVELNPNDLNSTLALGRALIQDGRRSEEGKRYLRVAAEKHPKDPRVWEAYLGGLADAGDLGEMASVLSQVPKDVVVDARLAEMRGRVAFDQGQWTQAVAAYRTAWEHKPYSKEILYRLIQAMNRGGQEAAAAELRPRLEALTDARTRLRKLYDKANSMKNLGDVPDYDLYHELAANRERAERPDEARAWYELVLRGQPDDPVSKAGLERLRKPDQGEKR